MPYDRQRFHAVADGLRFANHFSVTSPFRPAARRQESLLAPLEKRCLIWLAQHTPPWIHSDHLTALGFLALAGAGLCYWHARSHPRGLLLAILCLALNWLGDSLDGTLARVRNRQRPRYGFYVDHVVDSFGALFLLGGLALSGYMSPAVALALLVAYLLLSIEVYLATYALGVFELSHGKFSPTELRILLAVGNLALLYRPAVDLFGSRFRLFDVGGVIGLAGLILTLVVSVVRHTAVLYRAEPLASGR